MKRTLSFVCLAFLFLSFTPGTKVYTLKMSRIEIKRSPQNGGWRAAATLKQVSEPDNQDTWHSGEEAFDVKETVMPVNLRVDNLRYGEQMRLFIGLDDKSEEVANPQKAEDRLNLKFKVFPTTADEKVFTYHEKHWKVNVHYTLTH